MTLLTMAAAMVDGVYQTIFEARKPGIRANEPGAIANKQHNYNGSSEVEVSTSDSGMRCYSHRHTFTALDRLPSS